MRARLMAAASLRWFWPENPVCVRDWMRPLCYKNFDR